MSFILYSFSLGFFLLLSPVYALGNVEGEYGGAPDIAKIKQSGKLKIAIKDGDSSPFFYKLSIVDNNKFEEKVRNVCSRDIGLHKEICMCRNGMNNRNIIGIDVNLGCYLAAKLSVQPYFLQSESSFNGVVDQVIVKGEADIAISKLSITAERAEKALFSIPYATFRHGFMIDRSTLKDLDENGVMKSLREGDLRVGVIKDSSYVSFANQLLLLPSDRIDQTNASWEDLVNAVVEGKEKDEEKLHVAYRDVFEIKKVLSEQPKLSIKKAVLAFNRSADRIAILTSWEKTHLKYWLDEALKDYLMNNSFLQEVALEKVKKCKKKVFDTFGRKKYSDASKLICKDDEKMTFDADSVIKYMEKKQDKLIACYNDDKCNSD